MRAAARAAVGGEQGLLRDGGGEPRPPLLHCMEPPPVSRILPPRHKGIESRDEVKSVLYVYMVF